MPNAEHQPEQRSAAPEAASLTAAPADDGGVELVDGEQASGTAAEQYLLSRIGTLWLAIEARDVDEIAEPTEPTPVPRAPDHVRGIVSLHGHVLPLLDLQRFFQIDEAGQRPEPPESTTGLFQRIVVVSLQAFTVGLLCHQVIGVIGVAQSALIEPRGAMGGRLRSFVAAEIQLQDTVATVLDLASVLEAARVGV